MRRGPTLVRNRPISLDNEMSCQFTVHTVVNNTADADRLRIRSKIDADQNPRTDADSDFEDPHISARLRV